MIQDYYTSRAEKHLNDFDRLIRQVKAPIIERYGIKQADEVIGAARIEYRKLLPHLPYVGGEQPFTQFVIASGWFLSLYKAAHSRGEQLPAIGELAFTLSRTYLEHVPGYARRLLGYMTFSPRYLRKLRQRAEESQVHPNPRGYVFSFVESDAKNFDYGVDYHQCATWTFYQEHGAAGLTPYLCACDYLYSKLLGWGLTRTTTLGEGGKVCDFRFKRGGPTRVSSSVLKFE